MNNYRLRFLTHIYPVKWNSMGLLRLKGKKVMPIASSQTLLKCYSKCSSGAWFKVMGNGKLSSIPVLP